MVPTRCVPPPRFRRGVTLPELLLTMTIAGILTAIAVPRVGEAMRRHALDGAARRFVLDLGRAQSEAVRRNRAVALRRVGTDAYSIDGEAARLLPDGVRFAADAPTEVRFASFGPPATGNAAFTLRWRDDRRVVRVSAAGRVSLE